MKKGLTEIVFIIDRSGSMSGLENDTIGGFNSMIEKQKQAEGQAVVSTVLFDDEIKVLHDRVSIESIRKMTDKDYFTCGCTALLDAVGMSIDHIGNIHKNARYNEVPEKTVFVIVTDGLENSSRIYSLARIKKMIERQKERYGWEFLFIGANIDAVHTAGQMGIQQQNAVDYIADSKGTRVAYSVLNNAVLNVRRSKSLQADWQGEIKKDYNSRKLK